MTIEAYLRTSESKLSFEIDCSKLGIFVTGKSVPTILCRRIMDRFPQYGGEALEVYDWYTQQLRFTIRNIEEQSKWMYTEGDRRGIERLPYRKFMRSQASE